MLKRHGTVTIAVIAIILVNTLLVPFFVYNNYAIWNEFNNYNGLSNVRISPSWIEDYHAGFLSNGNFIPTGGIVLMPN